MSVDHVVAFRQCRTGVLMSIIHYLAYGSNLHPLRLTARVPAARALGMAEIRGYRLAFDKRGQDGSGKCLLYTSSSEHDTIYAALYAMPVQAKSMLDAHEGTGYRTQLIRCVLDGASYSAYWYAAEPAYVQAGLPPFYWYKELVLAGARYHHFPDDYIARIESVPAQPDIDSERTQKNIKLLKQLGADFE